MTFTIFNLNKRKIKAPGEWFVANLRKHFINNWRENSPPVSAFIDNLTADKEALCLQCRLRMGCLFPNSALAGCYNVFTTCVQRRRRLKTAWLCSNECRRPEGFWLVLLLSCLPPSVVPWAAFLGGRQAETSNFAPYLHARISVKAAVQNKYIVPILLQP